MANIAQTLLKHKLWRVPTYLVIVMLVFVCACITPVFRDHHLFYNLEPYPDSFTYVIPSWNFTQGQGFLLKYHQAAIKPNIFSSYSFFLITGLLVWHDVRVILIVNAFLGICLLWFTDQVLTQLGVKPLIRCITLIILVAHASLIWVAGLALTENVANPLLLGSVWATLLVYKKPNTRSALIFSGLLALVLLSRLSLVPVALGLWLLVIGVEVKLKQWSVAAILVTSAVISGLLFLWLQKWMGEEVLSAATVLTSSAPKVIYYSFNYIWPNMQFYLSSVLGWTHALLWLQTSLTTGLVTLLATIGVIIGCKFQFKKTAPLVLAIGLQLPTILVFYYQDNRYILPMIPLLVVLMAITLNWLFTHRQVRLSLILGAVTLGLLLVSQIKWYKQLVTDNLLFHSTAWQYESVKTFDAFFATHQGKIITTLPPFLIEVYQHHNFDVLPMSHAQEYLSKNRLVWGSDIKYQDLLGYYEQQLRAGETIYISNAYITHQQAVIADFEAYKQRFDLVLVESGCMDACNIYQLRLRPEVLNRSL